LWWIQHTLPAARQDLGAIKLDGQIREILVLVLKLAETILGLQECLKIKVNQSM